jgi:hypothetical protein
MIKINAQKIQLFRRFSKFPFVLTPITCRCKYAYHLLSHRHYMLPTECIWLFLNDSHNKTKFLISGLNKSRAPGPCDNKHFMVAFIICRSSVWNLLHDALMAPRILRRRLNIEKFVHPWLISLHIFDRRVFCGEPKCILWGRRFTWRPLPSLSVSRRPLTAQSRVLSQVSPCEICTGQSVTVTAFSQSTSAFPSLYHSTNTPYSALSTLCFTRRIKGRSLEIFQNTMFSKIKDHWREKKTHLFRK